MDNTGHASARFIALARILKARGIHGEVLLRPRGGISFSRLDAVPLWIVPPPLTVERSATISCARPESDGNWRVTFSNITDADTARELAGRDVLARACDLPDELSVELLQAPDLDFDPDRDPRLGLTVIDGERGSLGRVTDVLETGANDVLVVSDGPFGQVLIPVIPSVIGKQTADTLYVTLLPGLID
ncbi:MAG: hypothetical protein LBS17_00260 [Actinomycetes bacterium]|jgi:16S rRNA processing protein RimM|nr:hypothetical protein [Actinomycetes bacterium]